MNALRVPVDRASPDDSGSRPVAGGVALHPGDTVGGKYLLLHQLSAGGMGQVWCAQNSSTGAEVAVKTVLSSLASSSEAVERFRDEARATAQLAHRGIVRAFDLVEPEDERGPVLLVMELLRGHTLAQRLANFGPLSIDETLAIALPVLAALSHAHSAGVVHRDVKPDNIFLALDPDGELSPKVIDFGVSQLRCWGRSTRRDALAVGTPWYMSPDQARGEEVDGRCDVFGVGILLYECLSGTHPFRALGGRRSTDRRRAPPRIPTIPATLWAAIARALAERPEDRFSSAADLALALSTVRAKLHARRPVRLVHALGILATALVVVSFLYGPAVPSVLAQTTVASPTPTCACER
jgi:serine/threonine-protein kinase